MDLSYNMLYNKSTTSCTANRTPPYTTNSQHLTVRNVTDINKSATNPQQIEVQIATEFQPSGVRALCRRTCNKLCATTRRQLCVVNKLVRRRVVDNTIDLPFAEEKFSKSRVWCKITEESTCILDIPEFSYNTNRTPPCQNPARSV